MPSLEEHLQPAISHLEAGGVYRCQSPDMAGVTYTARLDSASEVIVVIGRSASGEIFSSAAAPNFAQFLEMAQRFCSLNEWWSS